MGVTALLIFGVLFFLQGYRQGGGSGNGTNSSKATIKSVYSESGDGTDKKAVSGETTTSSTKPNSDGITAARTPSGIAYYHCQGRQGVVDAKQNRHLVLLHGSVFTKENWKNSGILKAFCLESVNSVVALDLDVKVSLDTLLSTLQELEQQRIIELPLAALVTPSASGQAIIDGLIQGRVSRMTSAIQRWIPIACNAILKAPKPEDFANLKSWPILAIYGNKDSPGMASSKILEKHSGAIVKELVGGHPCYFDSPVDFVAAVVKFLSP